MPKREEGVIKCSKCEQTWPRFVYKDNGKIKEGPEDAMAKLQWHFQTQHSYDFSRLQSCNKKGRQ